MKTSNFALIFRVWTCKKAAKLVCNNLYLKNTKAIKIHYASNQ